MISASVDELPNALAEAWDLILRDLESQRKEAITRLSALDSAIGILSEARQRVDIGNHPGGGSSANDYRKNPYRQLKLPEAILLFFGSTKREGATCKEIREALAAGGQASASGKYAGQTVYNALNRLKGRKLISQDGRGWKPTAQES